MTTVPTHAEQTPPSTAAKRERDRRLFARIATGEVGALRVLFDQHEGRAMSTARRVLGDKFEAEDVVQETFVELWQRSSDFDTQRGSAASWVVTIARSRAIDRLRARVRTSRMLAGAAGDLQPAAAPTPDEIEDARRDHARLYQALAALTANQRAAMQMTYFDELTQAQIAARTGIPLGTVKLQRRTALAALSRLFRSLRRAACLGRRWLADAAAISRRRVGTGRYR